MRLRQTHLATVKTEPAGGAAVGAVAVAVAVVILVEPRQRPLKMA